MISGSINLLAVLVAAIFSMVLGGLWYSPVLFGKTWMKLAKIKPKNNQMAKSYIAGFVASIVRNSRKCYPRPKGRGATHFLKSEFL